MKIQSETKKRLARMISGVVNPFLVSTTLIFLVLRESTDNMNQCMNWFMLSIAISLVPLFVFTLILLKLRKIDNLFITVRVQRYKVYSITVVLLGIDCIVLYILAAPKLLIATFTVIFIIDIIFAIVNRYWKISIHAATITAAVTALFVLYGIKAAASLPLIPLVGWARVEIEHHSVLQVLVGGVSASFVLIVVYNLFQLI